MKENEDIPSDDIKLAKEVRNACVDAARQGFKEASMSGLCNEGAMEAAVSAIQKLDIETIIQKQK
jgi:hypothetical protein